MKIGIIGLGKMGHALALNMRDQGYQVVAYSRSEAKADSFNDEGLSGTASLGGLCEALERPRVIWLMVPAGEPVDFMIDQLLPLLDKEDILVDGGNSHYRDSLRRADKLNQEAIAFVDIGISGGPEGARKGACMMIGASKKAFSFLEPLVRAVCLEGGYLHVGNQGAGHYVKMIHNGIEYGMMQSIAEGFELLDYGPYELDYQSLAKLWNHGSVIRGWLIELTAKMFADDPRLEKIRGVIGSSGTGLWTVEEALARKVPLPVISQALFARYRSVQEDSFSARVVAGLRREFGGHDVEQS